MKKHIAMLAALALLLTCACGRAEEPETTAPVTTAAPTTEAPSEQAVSSGFRLEELPEIGSYQSRTVKCFYEEPLPEFRASDDYGTVIPYRLASNGQVPSYGMMTADGRIITGPVYSSVGLLEGGGRSVYSARLKTRFSGSPEEDDLNRSAYPENCLYQLILPDGSKCRSLSEVTPSVGWGNSALIDCRVWARDGGFLGDTLLLYDYDLEPVADLTDYHLSYAAVYAEEPDRFTVGADHTVYCFENGELKDTLPLEETIRTAAGGYLLAGQTLYRTDGTRLMSFSGDVCFAYDAARECAFAADIDAQKLLRLENGEVTAEYDGTGMPFAHMVLIGSGDGARIVLRCAEEERTLAFTVLDTDFAEV